jgi:hypothetical protein
VRQRHDRAAGAPGRFCVQARTRVNIANGLSANFVARDSAKVSERVDQPQCNTSSPINPPRSALRKPVDLGRGQ